jgi:hypothetical protein
MMVFRRGKKDAVGAEPASDLESSDELDELDDDELDDDELDDDQLDDDGLDDDDAADPDAVAGSLALVSPKLEAHERPWDASEAPAEGPPRLDLGGLLVPVLPDTEIRVELNEEKMPIAATILHDGSALQVLAFAAPRRDGIWDDVRGEIAESIRSDGGQVEEFATDLGIELRATVKATADQIEQQLRFVGFDGPRWFVRGVFSGPAAAGSVPAALLDSALRDLVVVRGEDAMAPRDPLPLRLPREATAAQEAAEAAAAENGTPLLDPLTRGPEITETR